MWAATVGAFLAPDLAVTEAEDYTCLTLLRDPIHSDPQLLRKNFQAHCRGATEGRWELKQVNYVTLQPPGTRSN